MIYEYNKNNDSGHSTNTNDVKHFVWNETKAHNKKKPSNSGISIFNQLILYDFILTKMCNVTLLLITLVTNCQNFVKCHYFEIEAQIEKPKNQIK